MFWVELTFKRYEDTMIFCFHFYFLFRTNGKRATRWRRLPSLLLYFFFERTTLKLLHQAMFKVLSQQLQYTLTTVFETIHYSWIFYGHGSPHELIFSWVNIFTWKSTRHREKRHLHNNPSLLFEEHWTMTFHLLL